MIGTTYGSCIWKEMLLSGNSSYFKLSMNCIQKDIINGKQRHKNTK